MKTKTYKGIGGTCGVMPYVMEGKSTSVFLSPEELFKSAAKLVNAPVVIKKHMSAEQAQKNKVGIVTSAYPLDNFSIGVDLQIWDEEAIKYIDSGNVELSAGYTATLSKGDDHWYGSSYAYKKEIAEFDHIAVLPIGDARNRVAKIFLNSAADDVSGNIETSFEFNIVNSGTSSTNSKVMTTKQIVLPTTQRTVEIDVDVAAYIENLKSNVASLQTKINDSNSSTNDEISTLTARLTDSKALLEKTITEKDQLIADQKAKLPKYLEIANKAAKLGISIDFAAFDPIDVMRRSLSSYPDIDKQSEETISYLFSTLKEPETVTLPEGLDSSAAKERTLVSDSNSSGLRNKVESTVATSPTNGVSAKTMSDQLAAKRRNAGIKAKQA